MVKSAQAVGCPRCNEEAKVRQRDFSAQALASLISWGEFDKKNIGQAICDHCYNELREALIEGGSDLETKTDNKTIKRVS